MDEGAKPPAESVEDVLARAASMLPGLLGMELTAVRRGAAELWLTVQRRHLAPNGFLHGGTVVSLADTACGYGTFASLPDGARGFTTVELKTNFLATTDTGVLTCRAELVHAGRTTQVWDATVARGDDRTVALFRCTQLLFYR